MNAAIISLGSVSSGWTFEAMKKHFDEVDQLDMRKIEMSLGTKREAQLLYDGQSLKHYDCIYVKGSFRYAPIARAITSHLCKESFLPIKANAFTIVHNKLLTQIKLQMNEIPTPVTYLTASAKEAKKLLQRINYPIVMKFPEGTQGKGVMFADSYPSASSVLDALQTLRQPFIIQEYIESGNSDIRAFVVGEKVVASMQRIAVKGEKRANIHAGGAGEPIELDTHTKKIAVKAAQALGVQICGVDILQSAKGPVVIELNISPGLQGITNVTGIDVAEKIARYLSKKTKDFISEDKDSRSSRASRIMDELGMGNGQLSNEGIVTNIDMRGSRLLLPEFVTKMAHISDDDEVIIKAGSGRIEIKKA